MSTKVSEARACVLGEIDLVHALGLAGIGCAVAAVPGDPALYSRHTKEKIDWFDPWDDSDSMLRALIAWAAGRSRKPVLYFNGDHDLLLVSRNRQELGKHFQFAIADEQIVEDLVDKRRFTELAQRLGLPVPKTVVLDTPDADTNGISFPAIVKPLTRRDDRWRPLASGGKAVRVDDADDWQRLWPALAGQGPVLVQAIIEGPESRVESYHAYVDRRGETLCEFTGAKVRTLPASFGDTTALRITDTDDVRSLGREVLAAVALTGVAKVDFKRDADGRLHLLEINPRFNLWHHAGAVAGANIPAVVFDDLTGVATRECSARPGVTWCHMTRDLKAAREEGLSFGSWARWAAGVDARWGLALRDPMPFLRGVVWRRARNKVRRA